MFGLSFTEIVVIVIVGVVVLGPRRLPDMMRTAGQWVGKLRRLSTDLRAQSGIDDLIRQEGLENEIRELRSLSRINVIDTLITPAAGAATTTAAAAGKPAATATVPKLEAKATAPRPQPLRHREYPLVGCDAYGALADDIPPRAPPPPAPTPAPAQPEPVASAAPASPEPVASAAPASPEPVASAAPAPTEPAEPKSEPAKEGA